MGLFERAADYLSGNENNEIPKEQPTQIEIKEGLEREDSKAEKVRRLRLAGDKESEQSGITADVEITVYELVEKYASELGLDTTSEAAKETGRERLVKFVLGQCGIESSGAATIDAQKAKAWIANLEELVKTGESRGLSRLRDAIKVVETSELLGEKEKNVDEAESFDEKVTQLKETNSPPSEYVKLIDSYLALGETTNRNELLGYRKLFSLPVASEKDAEIIQKVAVDGLTSGKAVMDSVAGLYEDENLSEETKTVLRQTFPDFPDTRTEFGVQQYALKKEEVFEQSKEQLSQNEKETETAEAELVNAEESGDETQIQAAKQKLSRLKQEKDHLKNQVRQLSDPESGNLRFKFRLQEATVKNEGGRKFMHLKWPNQSSYQIEINQQGRGFEQTYEKIVAYEGLGGMHGAARYLMQLPDGSQLANMDAKIGSMPVSALYNRLGLDRQFGEVMSERDQERFNRLAQCFDGEGTPLENLQTLGILTPTGNVDDACWEQTVQYMRQHIDEENFLTFRNLKLHLDQISATGF